MAANIDNLVKMFDKLGKSQSVLASITVHVDLGQYAKVYEILQAEERDLGMNTSWNKSVSSILTDKFSKSDATWQKDDQEALVSIMEYVMDRLNEIPDGGFSSSNMFMCLFYLNKRIIRTEGMWNYDLQGKLLDTIFNMKLPGTDNTKTRLTTFRCTMYATTWNEMRDHIKSESAKPLEMLIMASRWLVSDSVDNLSKVAIKLQKSVSWAFASRGLGENVDGLLRTLLEDLSDDYGKTLEKGVADGTVIVDKARCHDSQCGPLVQFTFACLTIAIRSADLSIAEMVVKMILDKSSPYFNAAFLQVLKSFAQLVINLLGGIYAGNVKDLPQKLQKFRTTTLSTLFKVQGSGKLFQVLLTSFLETVVYQPPWCKRACESMSMESFGKLVFGLMSLLPTDNILSITSRSKITVDLSPDLEINFIIYILGLVKEKVAQGVSTDAAGPSMMPAIQKCLDYMPPLLSKLNSSDNPTDLNASVGNTLYKLGNALENAGRAEESMDIYKKCVDSFIESPKDNFGLPPNFYFNVTTDTCLKLKEYRKGLGYLAHLLLKHQSTLLDEHLGSFDLFDPPCVSEWGTQWVRIKKAAKSLDIDQITVYELLHDIPESEEMMNQALLLELNSYFTCKCVLGDAIATVGEHLEDIGQNPCEQALGLLAQAIGFWWNDGDTNEDFCISACKNALEILNNSAKNNDEENTQELIISAIVRAWLAFTYSKRLSTLAKNDLDFVQAEEKAKSREDNPDKGFETETEVNEERIVPGISSVNLSHEHEVASLLISCVDTLYTIVNFDETEIKKWFDICPALILITVRLTACKISAMGDTFSSLRAWHVCSVLAQLYGRKYVQLMAGLEIYKQTPQSIRATIAPLEELMEFGIKNAGHYMPTTFFSRLHLVKSMVAFKEKEYGEGIVHLSKVLQNRTSDKSNVDAMHLVLAEAYHLLAQYRVAQESHKFSMESIDPCLVDLSPFALILNAYKLLCGITRDPNPISSGWQDLCFNQHLLLVMMDQMPTTLEILKASGNVKEMSYYCADMIHVSQSLGLISRTLELLVPLAETDILARQFEPCEEKVEAMYRMMTASDISMGVHRVELSQETINEALKKFALNSDFLIPSQMPNMKISLSSIESPESERSIFKASELGNPSSPTTISRKFSLPKYLFHSLSCSCYICLHPRIIPTTLKFVHLLIRLAGCGADTKTAIAIVPIVKTHHVKASFRVIYHFERMTLRLSQSFHAKKVGRDALQRAYLPFIFEPALHLLYTLAELCPVSDPHFIIKCCKSIQDGQREMGEVDKLKLLAPLELLSAALYEHYFENGGENQIENSNIRTILESQTASSSKLNH